MLDEGHRVLLWNDWMVRATGIDPQTALGSPIGALLGQAMDIKLDEAIDEAIACGRSSTLTARLDLGGLSAEQSKLISVQSVISGASSIDNVRRHCLIYVGMAEDTIDRQDASAAPSLIGTLAEVAQAAELYSSEKDLRAQNEWLSTLIDALPDLICFKDGNNRFLVANSSFIEFFRLGKVDYVNHDSRELGRLSSFYNQFVETWTRSDEEAWAAARSISFELTISLRDGGEKIFDIAKLPLFNQDGNRRGLVVIARDVTERKMAAARIHHLAHHDSLTGLPNRVLFQDRMRDALAQARRRGGMMALLLLDLDKFKEVNDTLGHHVGDLLLRAVAKRLGRCVRETDTVARLGGDEFAVLLTNLADADGASTVAETIIRSVAEPYGLDDNEVVCGISVGITIFPDDSQDAQSLLKNADLALYRSKNDGRGRYHFYVAEMDNEVQSRKAIERDLRHALVSDQLALYYQPLIDIQSGRTIGAEALIRWFHPQRGSIPPSLFIPVAERSELIFRLGRWVLQRACSQVREWNEAGLPQLQVSVNLSPAQFRHPDLLETIHTIVEQTGIDPRQLQLEITETIAMTNFEYSVEVLRELRKKGHTIAIDDFGTGYSSLSYLRHFPVDKLKIDRSFVVDLDLHPGNDAIVRAIVNLGHGIGAKVNVEGVETQEQLTFMRGLDCDECQGFFFSRPLPAADYVGLLAATKPWDLTGVPLAAASRRLRG
ncbi:EAL domain-containing protein [Telmatospirillum sp.]|uniref:putative bifunctional diguanylate cyclase/phosphodiesterase n=1 Tax=Telmatospirillum sp. TaxID=2079197 RepID=UPI0028525698|nr:EAL domain-containing protein [Telmatospirillum sp.]